MDLKGTISKYIQKDAQHLPYDSIYPLVAKYVTDMIELALPGAKPEHVGSTSVPKCSGKGIIDLMLPFEPDKLGQFKNVLDKLGFQPQSPDHPDPFPQDRPMLQGSISFYGTPYLVHLHLVPAASSEIGQFRFFRELLKNNPQILQHYADFKKQTIESGVTDSLEYCKTKSRFIKELLERHLLAQQPYNDSGTH